MPRGGQIGAAPGNLPASISHSKTASQQMSFPPTSHNQMFQQNIPRDPSPNEVLEQYSQSKANLRRLEPKGIDITSEAAKTLLYQSRNPVLPGETQNNYAGSQLNYN